MTVFSAIYRENRWNGVESLSGPGSGAAATELLRSWLPGWCRAQGVRSVLDVGCGDGWWMPDLPGYVGIDVAPEAIDRARANHPDRVYRVQQAWAVRDWFDLVIVRDVIQHLPFIQGEAVVRSAMRVGRRALMSTFVGSTNRDIDAGEAYSPDLTTPPFSLRAPDELFPDGFDYEDPTVVRDPAKHLGLWVTR